MMLAFAAAMLALAVPVASETKLGAGVTMEQATPIAALVSRPDEFVGKTVRVDGVATAVCTHMGCWMAVAADAKPGSGTVRLKVEDGVIVFPATAKGKRVSAQGVFEAVGDEHGKEAAGEHAKQDAGATRTYQIAATGALIK